MTVGEKIRRNRILHDMTQKQLGEAVGFKSNTADVRINQYETNKMSPKFEIRSAIASALDIDFAAISDVNISTFEDIMHAFFELEDKFDINIEKRDGKTCIVFDENNPLCEPLISYMNIWKNQKKAMLPDKENANDDQQKKYKIWRSRFFHNVEEYFQEKTDEVNNHYAPLVDQVNKSITHCEKTGDFIKLITRLIDSGFTVTADFFMVAQGMGVTGITFVIKELLSFDEEKQLLFATFLSEINHINELGAGCYTNIQMRDNNATISYEIPITTFSEVSTKVNEYLKFINDDANKNEFAMESFKSLFEDELYHSNNIEEEIKFYKGIIK